MFKGSKLRNWLLSGNLRLAIIGIGLLLALASTQLGRDAGANETALLAGPDPAATPLEPTATPAPSPTPEPSPTPTPEPSPDPTPEPAPTPEPIGAAPEGPEQAEQEADAETATQPDEAPDEAQETAVVDGQPFVVVGDGEPGPGVVIAGTNLFAGRAGDPDVVAVVPTDGTEPTIEIESDENPTDVAPPTSADVAGNAQCLLPEHSIPSGAGTGVSTSVEAGNATPTEQTQTEATDADDAAAVAATPTEAQTGTTDAATPTEAQTGTTDAATEAATPTEAQTDATDEPDGNSGGDVPLTDAIDTTSPDGEEPLASQAWFVETFDEPNGNWQPLSGNWTYVEGTYQQTDVNGYDYITELSRRPPTEYRVSVDITASERLNAGLILSQPTAGSRAGAWILDFTEDGTFLRWGTYAEGTGQYRYVGGAAINDFDPSATVQLSVESRADRTFIIIDGREIAAIDPLPPGRLGLVTSVSAAAFDNFVIEEL